MNGIARWALLSRSLIPALALQDVAHASHSRLRERLMDLGLLRLRHFQRAHAADDADDGGGASAGDADRAADGILAGPELVGHAAADQRHSRCALTIGGRERAPGQHGNPHGREVVRICCLYSRDRRESQRRRRFVRLGERQCRFRGAERQRRHARHLLNARDRRELLAQLVVGEDDAVGGVARGWQRHREYGAALVSEAEIGVLLRGEAAEEESGAEEQLASSAVARRGRSRNCERGRDSRR